jgi:outer membrane protein
MRNLVLLAAAAICVPAIAEAQDFTPKAAGHVMLNVRATLVDPDGGDRITTLAGGATGLEARVGRDVMPTIGLTYFFTDNVAVEVIAGTTKHTVRAKGPGVDVKVKDTWVLPPVVSLQYHLAPAAKVSPYVGAGVNYMLFYSGKDRNGFDLKLDDGFGVALQAGVDVALSGPWSANLDVKKVYFSTDAVDRANGIRTKVHLDPWVVSTGVGYRF